MVPWLYGFLVLWRSVFWFIFYCFMVLLWFNRIQVNAHFKFNPTLACDRQTEESRTTTGLRCRMRRGGVPIIPWQGQLLDYRSHPIPRDLHIWPKKCCILIGDLQGLLLCMRFKVEAPAHQTLWDPRWGAYPPTHPQMCQPGLAKCLAVAYSLESRIDRRQPLAWTNLE